MEKGNAASLFLEGDDFIAHLNQAVQINLFGSFMVSFLHAVEVYELASGLEHSFGKREELGLFQYRVFLRRQGGIVD